MNNKARNNLDRLEAFLADIDNQTKEETLAELRQHGIRTDEFLKKVNRIVDEGAQGAAQENGGIKKCAGGEKELNTAFSAAFGRFVEMMRRKAGFSVEQLAVRAGIEASEIESMEGSQDYTPEPSAVFQLARVFEIPARRLMQLAGLTEARDQRFIQATAQFAAHSKSLSALTKEEREVLEHYVAELTAEPPNEKNK